ncbi:hypothetical protein B484DRAFT_471263, partial [Ochromonadaceae sp. CCMP2298]
VDIGHVFYKDGEKYVAEYTVAEVKDLVRNALPARQATFSFIPLSDLHNCNFTTAQQGRQGGPHMVVSIDTAHFQHTGATGVDNGKEGGWERVHGKHAVKLNGRTYHYLPKTGGAGGLQYFTFDASQTQITNHENTITSPGSRQRANLQSHFLKRLYTELLQCNYFVQDCELVGSTMGAAISATPSFQADAELRASINIQTNVFDIAAITSDVTTGERILTYKLKHCAKARCIPSTSTYLEPLSYPLLFPYGEDGWSIDIAKEFPFTTYLCNRMLCPELRDSGEQLTSMNKDESRCIPTNRFQLMARLGQLYLVDMTSRVIDFRLNFQRINANHFHGGQDWQAGAHED